MTDKSFRYLVMIVFMILGIALSIQFRSILYTNKQKASIKAKYEDIVKQVEYEKALGANLKEKIDKNASEKDNILKNFTNSQVGLTDLKKDWEQSSIKAGLTSVSGRGVNIVLNDAVMKNPDKPNLSIIHDTDVLKIVNELNKGGAQAISINGERIISSSEIVCTGPTIRVNRTRFSVPFDIKAIGDTHNMEQYLDKSPILNALRRDGIRIDIKKLDNIVISKFNRDQDYLISGLEVVNN